MEFEDYDIPAAEEDQFSAPPPVPEYTANDEALVVPPSHEIAEVYDMPEPDPVEEDALSRFHREWSAKLEAKRAAEFDQDKSAREKANGEMDQWKTQREIRLNAKKDSNRSEEQVFVESLTSETELLKTWDRVSKLIDAGENAENKGSDTSRMRKIFIQLKNEPLESTRAVAVK